MLRLHNLQKHLLGNRIHSDCSPARYFSTESAKESARKARKFEYAVIGGGPAGILALGRLLDKLGPKKFYHEVVWYDPNFKVGMFWEKWYNVPSNSKTQISLDYLSAAKSFGYNLEDKTRELNRIDPGKTCRLGIVGKELIEISHKLRTKVHTVQGIVKSIDYVYNRQAPRANPDPADDLYRLTADHYNPATETFEPNPEVVYTKNIIYCPGSLPIVLPLKVEKPVIDLELAMDHMQLQEHVQKRGVKSIAVYGSSHSSFLVIRNAVRAGVERIVNFYQKPILHAEYLEDWIRHDNTGLKGEISDWVKEHVEKNPLSCLERYKNSDPSFDEKPLLDGIDEVIFTVGFGRPASDHVQLMEFGSPVENPAGVWRGYDSTEMRIMKNMWGMGICFPKKCVDKEGTEEMGIGLEDFQKAVRNIEILK